MQSHLPAIGKQLLGDLRVLLPDQLLAAPAARPDLYQLSSSGCVDRRPRAHFSDAHDRMAARSGWRNSRRIEDTPALVPQVERDSGNVLYRVNAAAIRLIERQLELAEFVHGNSKNRRA